MQCWAGLGAVRYQSPSPRILGASSSLLNLSEKMNIICCSQINTFAELFIRRLNAVSPDARTADILQ